MTINSGIVLYGSGNAGKTSTLLKLISHLNSDQNYYLIHSSHTFAPNTDIQCCFKFIANNKKIAIGTSGDTKKQVTENLAYCVNYQADIFVMPARSYAKRNGSRSILIDYAKKNQIYLIWLWKSFVYMDVNKQNIYNILQDDLIDELQNNEVNLLNNYLTRLL